MFFFRFARSFIEDKDIPTFGSYFESVLPEVPSIKLPKMPKLPKLKPFKFPKFQIPTIPTTFAPIYSPDFEPPNLPKLNPIKFHKVKLKKHIPLPTPPAFYYPD